MTNKQGSVLCLACGEKFLFLTTSHMQTHQAGRPQSDPEYKEWAAEKWDVDEVMYRFHRQSGDNTNISLKIGKTLSSGNKRQRRTLSSPAWLDSRSTTVDYVWRGIELYNRFDQLRKRLVRVVGV